MQEYLNIHDQFKLKLSNNTNVFILLLKKTYNFSKNYSKIHKNLQVIHKVFEKMYLHSTKILITHTNL